MLCLHNTWGIFKKLSWLYYLYLQIWNWLVLYIYETFLVYKLETFKNFKEVKHIMIMIIAIIYMFIILWDNWSIVENYLQKILSPPEKIYSPLKVQKVQVPSFCQHWKFFRPPCRKGGRTLLSNFTKHNQMIHDPMMQDSCINFVFLYVSWTDWCKKQPTLHWKHHWIIQIGFDLFLVEQKPDKITYIFLLPMHISFNNQSHLFCLDN